MSAQTNRVVFDCNVYFQALISVPGPSARCVDAASRGEVRLFCSEQTIDELLEVASRQHLRATFFITDAKVAGLIALIRRAAEFASDIPDRYHHPIDADDSHYVNLALATHSQLIVSRDRDMLRLMNASTREGAEFQRLYPELRVLQPDDLLRSLPARRDD